MMKRMMIVACAAMSGLALMVQPAEAASHEDDFVFHFQPAELQSAEGRLEIENRLDTEVRRYCRNEYGFPVGLSMRWDCERTVKEAVNEALDERAPEWRAHRTAG